MRRNNQGMSLVEIVIVVAIMAVLTAIMSIGVGSVLSRPADECAQKIVSTVQDARVTAMGKRSCELSLKQASDGAVINVEQTISNKTDKSDAKTNTTKVGEKGITVTVTNTKNESFKLYEVDALQIIYNRETGGFKEAKYKTLSDGSTHSEYIKEIKVEKGNRTRTIKFYYLTGKVEIN